MQARQSAGPSRRSAASRPVASASASPTWNACSTCTNSTASPSSTAHLGRQATHRGWWHSYADALPAYFEDYVGLEDGAKSLSTYQNQLVHGLMQTADYAAAVLRAAQPARRRTK